MQDESRRLKLNYHRREAGGVDFIESREVGGIQMQFIEKNSLNVRSAVYLLKKDGTGLEFLVFPMIHVGSREFYDEINRRLSSSDLVLAEGVKSKKGNMLTPSYRII